MDEGFGHWLAGFTDGEGCFYLNGPHLYARFSIGLRADDWQVLEYIRQQIGVGIVRRHRASPPLPGYTKTKLSAVYDVWRAAELLKIVAIFEEHPLRAKKRHQFEVWRAAVRELAKGRGLYDKAFVAQQRAQLAELRVFDDAAVDEVIVTVRPRPHGIDRGAPPLCLCGCGIQTGLITHSDTAPHPDNSHFNRFVRGHHRRLLFADLDEGSPPACMCGCGQPTRVIASVNYKTLFHPDNMHFRRFVNGHNRRGLRFLTKRR